MPLSAFLSGTVVANAGTRVQRCFSPHHRHHHHLHHPQQQHAMHLGSEPRSDRGLVSKASLFHSSWEIAVLVHERPVVFFGPRCGHTVRHNLLITTDAVANYLAPSTTRRVAGCAVRTCSLKIQRSLELLLTSAKLSVCGSCSTPSALFSFSLVLPGNHFRSVWGGGCGERVWR